jgi:predicted ABC-type ATPase
MDEIYTELKKGVRKPKNKTAIFLCGTAGSGKTSNRLRYIEDMGLKTTFILLQLDHIWNLTHRADSINILDDIMEKTIEDGYSFYYEGTCRIPEYIIPKIEKAKKNGYTIKFGLIYAELDTVLKRVKARTEQLTPLNFTKLVYSQLKKHAGTYMKTDLFDEIYLYNNDKTTKLIFYKNRKEVECISPDSKFYFDVSEYC